MIQAQILPDVFLFLTEEAYEDYIQSGYDVGSYTFENETMISITEEDGKVALVTQCSEEKAAEFITELGYEPQEGDVVQWRYQIDPENSFITSSSSVLIRNDGTETTLSEESLNTEPEEYVFSSEITERLDSEDSRTVTIITNPGTDQEAVFQETVGKGCSVAPIGYNDVLYTDEACTEEFSSNSDTESDVTLYAITDETDEGNGRNSTGGIGTIGKLRRNRREKYCFYRAVEHNDLIALIQNNIPGLCGGLLIAGRKTRSQRTDFFKAGIVAHLNGNRPLFHHFHQCIYCFVFF